jgi:hypothetical protein
MINTAAKVALGVLGKMATKLISEKFFRWAILWGAKRLVESTDSKHDDEWYKKIAEILDA